MPDRPRAGYPVVARMTTAPPANPSRAPADLESAICLLDGERQQLGYRGYDVRTLSESSTYEEVAFLLVQGRLPEGRELRSFGAAVRRGMRLKPATRRLLAAVAGRADAMTALRTVVAGLPATEELGEPWGPEEAAALTGKIAGIVAALHHRVAGTKVPEAVSGESFAANVLRLLGHDDPDVRVTRAFDAALILRADNELNPSAYAARVAASCGTDLCGCVAAALAALGGPQHGGHSSAVRRMLEEVGSPGDVGAWVAARVSAGGPIPGFGHPVYREDPRTATTRGLAEVVCRRNGMPEWFELAQKVEERVVSATGKAANVDYYLGVLYKALGIPLALYTPIFAVARIAGWIAHAHEQRTVPGLIRPRATYLGPRDLRYPERRRPT